MVGIPCVDTTRTVARPSLHTIETQGVDGYVVGLPVTEAGDIRDWRTDSQAGRRCRNFARTLATGENCPHPYVYFHMHSASHPQLNPIFLSSFASGTTVVSPVPVVLVDEGKSSQAAEDMLEGFSGRAFRNSNQAIDSVAACVILERYYDNPGQCVRIKGASTFVPPGGKGPVPAKRKGPGPGTGTGGTSGSAPSV